MPLVKPRIIKKPWGREEIWGDIEGVCIGKTIHIDMGHRLSRQYHEKKEEVIHVVRGVLRVEAGLDKNGKPEKILSGGPDSHTMLLLVVFIVFVLLAEMYR